MNKSVQQFLTDNNTFVSSITLLLVDQFGLEFMQFEPQAIQMDIEETFNIKVDRYLKDKIEAGFTLLSNDLYFKSIEGFNIINSVMNLKVPSMKDFTMTDLEDVMWGVTEARLLLGDEIWAEADISHDVRLYTGKLLAEEGITTPPKILSFAEFNPVEMDNRDIILAGDAALTQAYWERQDIAISELETWAKNRLSMLFEEAKQLPLNNRAILEEKDIKV